MHVNDPSKELLEGPDAERGPSRLWSTVAVAVLVAAAFAATFVRIYNFDIFWHLASGQWMLEHGRILDFDPYSIRPEPRWVNVHWLFQVIVALLHSAGGMVALTALKASLAAAAMLTLCLALRRHVPPAWLVVSGLLMLMVIVPRVRVRPEAFTYAFLMLTIVLVDGVRRGCSPRRLWWLVPVMLAWVNMHGLYILGLAVMWSGAAGACMDRRLKRGQLAGQLLSGQALAAMLAATVAILLTPWPLEAALHPLLLWTRVSGGESHYTYGVSELAPTWQHLGNYHVEGLVVLYAACAMFLNRRRLPSSHVLWLAAFIAVAMLAIRNTALIGPIAGFITGWHGGEVLGRIGLRWPRLRRIGPWLAGLAVAATVALILGTVSGAIWRVTHRSYQFGPGLRAGNYPLKTAAFLRDLPAKGDLLCENFGDGGVFIYGSYPQRLLYMDGRLEAHSLQRFLDHHNIGTQLRTSESAETVRFPEEVRFLYVSQRSSERLSAAGQTARFSLLYFEPAGACFARSDWPGLGGKIPAPNFAEHDRPLGRDGLVEGFDFERRTAWAQNPRPLNYQFGSLLLSLGQQDRSRPSIRSGPVQQRCMLLATRYLRAAQMDGLMRHDIVNPTLAQAYQQRALAGDVPPSPSIPADMNTAAALALYRKADLSDLGEEEVRKFAMQQIVALKDARQLDAASQAVDDFFAHLPGRDAVSPPREYLDLRDTIRRAVTFAQTKKAELDARRLSPGELADALTAADTGLILAAITELQADPQPTAATQMKLGDLLLRRGLHEEARRAYARVKLDQPRQWELSLRKALCDWAAGDLFAAYDALLPLAGQHDGPLVAYYLAELAELLGHYDVAFAALVDVESDDLDLAPLIDRARSRLQGYAD